MPIFSQQITDHVANTMPQPYYRFDGSNDQILVSDDANLSAGAGDFSQLVSFRTPISSLFGGLGFSFYRNAGSTLKEFFRCSSSQIEWYSQDGTGNASYVTANLALDADNRYTIVAVADRSDTNHLYINGREVTIVGSNSVSDAYSISYSADLFIGNYASQNYATGELYAYQRWNKALTATEVADLYGGASVPWKYKNAGGTISMTNANFEAGDGSSWNTDSGTWSISTTRAHGGTYSVKAHGGTNTYFRKAETITTIIGKRYRASCWVWQSTSDANNGRLNVGTSQNGTQYGQAARSETESWVYIHVDFTSIQSTVHIAFKGDNSPSEVYYDDLEIIRIGAVAEYDGSGISSDKWFDKSGNDLHGTVSGATVENAPSDTGVVPSYETGTWTILMKDGSANALSHDNKLGSYVKIGQMVHITVYTNISSLGSASGDVTIHGLPFTCANGIQFYSNLTFVAGANLALPTAGDVPDAFVVSNTSTASCNLWSDTVGAIALTAAHISANGSFVISGTYHAAT